MSKITTITYHYTPSQFRGLLSKFQDAIDHKQYSEKIPYDTWRKMMRITDDVQIDFVNPFVKIFNPKDNNVIYSAKVYNWGFGRFFYDEVIKKEWNKDMTLNSTDGATFTCNTADIDSNALNWLAGVSTTLTNGAESAAHATALDTKADYMGYYDSDSTTSCPNYGTTTDHTVYVGDNYNVIWESTGTAVTNITTIGDRVDTLENQMKQLMNEKKKENDNMKGFNFDFGPCGNTVRLSMYGMAIQNVAGEWVSYNPDSGEIINVDVFNMPDGGKYMYKMPVAIADVAVGDVVIHNRVPMFVTAIGENGTFTVTDVRAGESKNIIPTRNMFGFNFMTKVVSMFSAFSNAPTADQPFGNMLPFLMCGEGKDIDPMMMFFMMGQGGNTQMNPMMMYIMMKDNKDFDPMMLFAMSSLMNQPAHTCNCSKTPVNPAAQV